jgi:hypothetical protein
MDMIARGFRELLILAMVVSIPLLAGRALYRLVAVAFPDWPMDTSESAADGVGFLFLIISLLTYLIVRSVRFVRRRRGGVAPHVTGGAGIARAAGLLIATFFLAAVGDGLSKSLLDASRTSPQPEQAAVVPPVPEIPPPLPEFAPVPDLTPSGDPQTLPAGLTAGGIARGIYACRIGLSNFLFAIKNDNESYVKEFGIDAQSESPYTYDPATRAIHVINAEKAELRLNQLTYVPEGMAGSEPDRNGPGIEMVGFSLDETKPPTGWCAFMDNAQP